MDAIIDAISEHARAYAKQALRGGGKDHKPDEHLDAELSRYHSELKRHAFLTHALRELDSQLQQHLDIHHKDDPEARARCGQRPWHDRAKAMVEDRLAAIKERQNPLRGMLN